jgi:hypothetical protein
VARFIAAQRVEFGVPYGGGVSGAGRLPGVVLPVCHGDGSPRRTRRRALAALIAALFAHHRSRYGAPRHKGVPIWPKNGVHRILHGRCVSGWLTCGLFVAVQDVWLLNGPERRAWAMVIPGTHRWGSDYQS